MTCPDPGNVEHSHKVLTGTRYTVGSTVQFVCNKGYVLSGNSLLTCYNRDSAAPKWSERLPKCVRKSEARTPRTQTHKPWNLCFNKVWHKSSVVAFYVIKRVSCMCPASQLKSTSHAGTPALPRPACRALKRPFTKRERRWASPVTLATSCRATAPSTVSPDTPHSGTAPHLPAEVNHAHTHCTENLKFRLLQLSKPLEILRPL